MCALPRLCVAVFTVSERESHEELVASKVAPRLGDCAALQGILDGLFFIVFVTIKARGDTVHSLALCLQHASMGVGTRPLAISGRSQYMPAPWILADEMKEGSFNKSAAALSLTYCAQ